MNKVLRAMSTLVNCSEEGDFNGDAETVELAKTVEEEALFKCGEDRKHCAEFCDSVLSMKQSEITEGDVAQISKVVKNIKLRLGGLVQFKMRGSTWLNRLFEEKYVKKILQKGRLEPRVYRFLSRSLNDRYHIYMTRMERIYKTEQKEHAWAEKKQSLEYSFSNFLAIFEKEKGPLSKFGLNKDELALVKEMIEEKEAELKKE